MRAGKWLALFVVALAMVLPNAANAALVNCSFENGTTGWDLYIPGFGDHSVPPVHESDLGNFYFPQEGNFFLRLQAGNPAEYSTAAQAASFAAGEKVAGWAFFDAWDELPFNDWASVQIYSGSHSATDIGKGLAGAPIAVPFSEDVASVGDFGDGPWTSWSHTFAAAGTYTVAYKVRNAVDELNPSVAGFDCKRIPEASSMVLFGLGLVSLLGFYRRQTRSKKGS
jgi:hypothetical protein